METSTLQIGEMTCGRTRAVNTTETCFWCSRKISELQFQRNFRKKTVGKSDGLVASPSLTPHGRGHITGYVEHFCSFYVDITGYNP